MISSLSISILEFLFESSKEYCYSSVNGIQLSSNWNGWFSTVRTGVAQNIYLDVKSLPDDKRKVAEIISEIFHCHKKTAEFIVSNFFSNDFFNLTSAVNKKWSYIRLPDLMYSISLINSELRPDLTKFIIKYTGEQKELHNIRISIQKGGNEYISNYLHRNGA